MNDCPDLLVYFVQKDNFTWFSALPNFCHILQINVLTYPLKKLLKYADLHLSSMTCRTELIAVYKDVMC